MMKCIAKIIVLWVMIFLSPVLFAAELNSSIQKIAKELSVQMKTRQAKKLAVANFSDLNGYQSILGDFIAEELVTALYKEGEFDIVERRELSRILSEQAKYTSNIFDKKTVAQLQKLLGIDVLVIGTIADLGQQIKLNSRAINVETGKVFAAASASIDRDQTINNLMQQSSNSNSGTGVGAKQGSLQQPSNVYFKNKILYVIPTGVVKLDDKKGFRITTQFRNLTNEPLSIASYYNDARSSPAFASTELGDFFNLRITGTNYYQSFDTNDVRYQAPCTVIEPNSFINVIWDVYTDSPTSIKGSNLTVRSNFINCTGPNSVEFAVQLSDIKLN